MSLGPAICVQIKAEFFDWNSHSSLGIIPLEVLPREDQQRIRVIVNGGNEDDRICVMGKRDILYFCYVTSHDISISHMRHDFMAPRTKFKISIYEAVSAN